MTATTAGAREIDPLMTHLAAQVNSWKDQTIRESLRRQA
jgi:hypothetical protein